MNNWKILEHNKYIDLSLTANYYIIPYHKKPTSVFPDDNEAVLVR